MKMSRTLLLAASLFVSSNTIVVAEETGNTQPVKAEQQKPKVEQPKAEDTVEAKDKNATDATEKAGILGTIVALPALAKDKLFTITDKVASYSINLLTSRTLGKTRFAEYVTTVDRVVIGTVAVCALYKLYDTVYNQEEENNDEIFNIEDLN